MKRGDRVRYTGDNPEWKHRKDKCATVVRDHEAWAGAVIVFDGELSTVYATKIDLEQIPKEK